jgi:hypothetical protein
MGLLWSSVTFVVVHSGLKLGRFAAHNQDDRVVAAKEFVKGFPVDGFEA